MNEQRNIKWSNPEPFWTVRWYLDQSRFLGPLNRSEPFINSMENYSEPFWTVRWYLDQKIEQFMNRSEPFRTVRRFLGPLNRSEPFIDSYGKTILNRSEPFAVCPSCYLDIFVYIYIYIYRII